MALVELYRATGDERYLEQARLLRRAPRPAGAGRHRLGRAYFQDDMPIREAEAFRGHAVRALYLASGAVDVAVETGDRELLQAIIAPVGADDRAPHVPDRRHGLPAHRRVVRRGLRAAARPRLLGDLRRRRLRPARLAAAARHRRRPLRRPDRADACSTSSPPHRRSTAAASSTPTRCTSGCRARRPIPTPRTCAPPPRLRAPWFHVSCCPTNVARTLRQPGRLRRHRRRRRRPAPPAHGVHGARRRRAAARHHRLPVGERGRRARRGDRARSRGG